jgi:7-cyano-7-deazaguanine synthase
MKKAIVLLSGGLDSATVLFYAKRKGYRCSCLIFDYGQRHKRELVSARVLARITRSAVQVVRINFPRKGSVLLEKHARIPSRRMKDIPPTYVPARNIVFLSCALSYAEAQGAEAIFIGAHAQDYSGYPDCRPEFFRAFRKVIATGTKSGVEQSSIRLEAPLLQKTKAEIIRLGKRLGVPFALTWSCYRGGKTPCGECDSCYYRKKGFAEAGIGDPLYPPRKIIKGVYQE